MDNMVIVWLAAIVVFVVVEAITVQLLCIWFAASSLVALIFALFKAPEFVQIIVFVVCTVVLLIFTRPVVRRLMKGQITPTNADRILGMTAVVIQEINNDMAEGQVKVSNQIWSARSLRGNVFPVDTKVIFHSIEGVKVIVEDTSAE